MKTIMSGTLILLSVIVFGCSSSYTLLVDKNSKEAFITFSKDSNVKAGDVFAMYKMNVMSGSGGGHNHGGGGQHLEKFVVGRIQVVKLIDDEHASVKLLSGSVADGVSLEKIE